MSNPIASLLGRPAVSTWMAFVALTFVAAVSTSSCTFYVEGDGEDDERPSPVRGDASTWPPDWENDDAAPPSSDGGGGAPDAGVPFDGGTGGPDGGEVCGPSLSEVECVGADCQVLYSASGCSCDAQGNCSCSDYDYVGCSP